MQGSPLIVHCCHRSCCRRETGPAFVLNAFIGAVGVTLLHGAPELVMTPSACGRGQMIARCPDCRVVLWSDYAGAGDPILFVRVGRRDEAGRVPRGIQIFTRAKLPCVVTPEGARAVPAYHDRREVWSAESLERRKALKR